MCQVRDGHWVVDCHCKPTWLCRPRSWSVCALADNLQAVSLLGLRKVSLKRQISTPCWLNTAPPQAVCHAHSPHSSRPGVVLYPIHPQSIQPYSARQLTILKRASSRATPVGREEIKVSSRRVSSTHASMGSWSRSEMSRVGRRCDEGLPPVRVMRVCSYGFGIRNCRFNRSCLSCFGFRCRLFRLGRRTGGCHFWLSRCLRDLVTDGDGSNGGIDMQGA
jgi:hypothetical protein